LQQSELRIRLRHEEIQGAIVHMSLIFRATRLATIVEAASCIGMIFQTNPYGFDDKLCDFLGWSPRAVSEVLVGFSVLLNWPVEFLSFHVFGSTGFAAYNGRLVFANWVGIAVLLIQCVIWSLVFFGLLEVDPKN
jgi:hypothetical protein